MGRKLTGPYSQALKAWKLWSRLGNNRVSGLRFRLPQNLRALSGGPGGQLVGMVRDKNYPEPFALRGV